MKFFHIPGLLYLGNNCTKTARRELGSDEVSAEAIRKTVQGALERIRSILLPAYRTPSMPQVASRRLRRTFTKSPRRSRRDQISREKRRS
jgi:hypothetical protein